MKLMQLFSEEVSKIFNEWEVRVLILLSLLLQIILIIFGSQRKYRTRIWIRFLVWTTYMAADWVATVALGNLAKIQANSETSSKKQNIVALQTFWAPFLLLHLGGPDTITAYSLEDNELWSRHLLGLFVEVGVAFYIFFRSLNNTALTFLSIPVFISGIIKYGERTYTLWSASSKHFKEALLSTNSDAENAMRMSMGIKEEDSFEMALMEEPRRNFDAKQLNKNQFDNLHKIEKAYFLFKRFENLFANLILGFRDRSDCYKIITAIPSENAFELIAIELGFMYDVLYTKANTIRTRLGFFLRAISFFSSVSALVAFWIVTGTHAYSESDIYTTFLLLGGAVFLEVYAFVILLFSDWTKLWLVKHQTPKINCFHNSRLTKKIDSFHNSFLTKWRWSASIAQYNLISFCIKDIKGIFVALHKFPYFGKLLEEYHYLGWKYLTTDMQTMIFKQLQDKAKKIEGTYTTKSCKEILAQRGDHVLEECQKLDEFASSTIGIDFDHSLLVWHIATDICYYVDSDEQKYVHSKISRCLSDYMLYLLVLCPSMLPKGIGEMRYKDTCDQIMQLLREEENKACDKEKFCKMLFEKTSKRPITQSILSDGCELAKKLHSLQESAGWSCEQKWNMIRDVWVEMLAYAASHCGWKEHAQQLWKGGELLTHVCLLMAHLGLSEQYNEKEQFYLI